MIDSIVFVSLFNLGLLFCIIECVHLGLISPIEVVEDLGCHDTELRLTCGNLDSKLAILEATFTPNCTHDECLRYDMKRLVRTFASAETEDSTNAEKVAGQKFLETLRQSHSKEKDIDVDILENGDPTDENIDRSTGQKQRTTLRLVLERLIIRYLRRISPDDDLDGESFSRSRRNILQESSQISSASDLLVNGTIEELNTSEEDVLRTQSARPHCEEQRRQISSLNRLDLEKSYRNQSENEYNIRRVLNKRCSGKNHCSFIFSIDHPFSKVWQGGVVRVKYICMEDFRINRYCGEHLTIGYEIDPNTQILDTGKGDPKAEPRIQPRETSLHSLKIIKADKGNSPDGARNLSMAFQEPRTVNIATSGKHRNGSSEGYKNRVYSQDFRVLKILPSNLDDFNDIETIGDQIYFRKDETSTEETNVNEHSLVNSTHVSIFASESEGDSLRENETLNTAEFNKALHNDTITLTIRDGGQYITVYSVANATLSDVPSNLSLNGAVTNKLPGISSKSLLQNASYPVLLPYNENELEFKKSFPNASTKKSIANDLPENMDDRKSGDKEQENIFDVDELRNLDKSRITYNSIQRTSYRSPLLHGFAMTPGYPKFYIGEFDCQWNIIAPQGIRVWISIIDNSLRFDDLCRDFLQIDDYGINRTLFKSCNDVVQPIGIISTSNWVKVTVKTTSKFAYPKRGVLLHYTADGCVNPPLPTNVKLVDRTPTTAFYECHASFLFPDTGLSNRKLTCNSIYVWDKFLPDCIEQENLYRSEVPAEETLTLINKKPDLSVVTSIMPSQKDADMVFDIIIPTVLIAGLFIINGAVFAIIMKYRKRSKALGLGDREMELAEL